MLALGDLKAILARMLGATEAIRLLQTARAGKLMGVNCTDNDGEAFNNYRNTLWQRALKCLPIKA